MRHVMRSRRAVVLLLFGTVFVIIGCSYIGLQREITASPIAAQSYAAHLKLMPLDAWGWLFIACGAAGIGGGLTGYHTAGFTALMLISSWWGAEFLASWASTGYNRAVLGALTWLLVVGVLAVIVGWRDPPRPLLYDPEGS